MTSKPNDIYPSPLWSGQFFSCLQVWAVPLLPQRQPQGQRPWPSSPSWPLLSQHVRGTQLSVPWGETCWKAPPNHLQAEPGSSWWGRRVTRRTPPQWGQQKERAGNEQTSRICGISRKPEHHRVQKMIFKCIEVVTEGLYPRRTEQGLMNWYCSKEIQRAGKPEGKKFLG